MFTEREALRLRLEQLHDAEIIRIREIQNERNRIYTKLRELDQFDVSRLKKKSLLELTQSTLQDLKEDNKQTEFTKSTFLQDIKTSNKQDTPANSQKSSPLRSVTLDIMKNHKDGINSADLKKAVQNETGIQIKNMTVFMQTLMKRHPEIKKPYRGQYVLDQGKPKSTI
ncbi:transcriptional repressor Rok [Bacillus paralicheniformis]|uniref:Rok-like winged helix domain-containing protein n=1 Tax=Bacillus paralicheniformis TaxID=1648923 RepID=UPI0034D31E6D